MSSRDDEGYLVEPESWTEDIARQIAAEEKIELNDEHWVVIRFMRDYYEDHQIAPGCPSCHETSETGMRRRPQPKVPAQS